MEYPVRRLCQTLTVHPSGSYAWLGEPKIVRAKEDQCLLGLIKHAWLESGGVHGYGKIHDDLRELGEFCGRHRVARLMRVEKLRSQTRYRRQTGSSLTQPPGAAIQLRRAISCGARSGPEPPAHPRSRVAKFCGREPDRQRLWRNVEAGHQSQHAGESFRGLTVFSTDHRPGLGLDGLPVPSYPQSCRAIPTSYCEGLLNCPGTILAPHLLR